MEIIKHLSTEELEAGLETIRNSPKYEGALELIVRRPKDDEREVLDEGQLDTIQGLVGDNWKARGSKRTADKSAHPNMQINIMNSRVIALLAQDKQRWQLAGDQLFIDMDLSVDNLPAGAKLSIGDAILEVTAEQHSACNKFSSRYGEDAMRFVNSPIGKELRLRGVNAKIIKSGRIRAGDIAKKEIT